MGLVPATPAREVIQPGFQSLSVKQWHQAGASTWCRLRRWSAHTDDGSVFPSPWSESWDVLETFVCVCWDRGKCGTWVTVEKLFLSFQL